MLETARALTAVIDRDLAKMQGDLTVLASSRSLAEGDLRSFYRHVQSVLQTNPGADIILSDPSGQQLVNSYESFGKPLPKRSVPQAVRSVYEAGRPVISNLHKGAITGRYMISVNVPVFRAGRVIYVLAMATPVDHFATILEQQHFPPEWVGRIFDGNQVIVAWTPLVRPLVGQRAVPEVAQAVNTKTEGSVDAVNLEGVHLFNSFSRSPVSNWTVIIGVPTATLRAEIWRWLGWTVAGTVLLSAVGIWLASFIARGVDRLDALSRRTQQWLRVTLSSIGDAVVATDTAGRIVFLNPTAAKLTGWQPEEAAGQPSRIVLPMIDEKSREASVDIVAKVLDEGKPVALANHTALITKDGREIPIEDSAAPILDGAGTIVGAVLVFHDVTDKRRTREALQESEARLSAALASMTDAVVICDVEGRIYAFNDAFAAFHKFQDKSNCPTTLDDFSASLGMSTADGKAAPAEMRPLRRALRGETGRDVEYELLRKDTGENWTASYSFAPVLDGKGEIAGAVAIARDITAQKLAEEALRDSEERLRALADNLPYSFVYQYTRELDGTPRFLYVSAGVERLNGVKVADVLNDANVLYLQSLPEELPGMREAEEVSARDLSVFMRSMQVRLPDGRLRWMHLRSRPRRLPDGRTLWDGVQTDITDSMRAERALQQSEEQLALFVEQAPAALAMFDREMRYLHVSRYWLSDYGLGDRELRGLSHYEVFPEIGEEWKQMHRRGLAGEVLHSDADRFVRADGSEKWERWVLRPWYDGEGNVGGIVIYSEDITERKRTEEALLASLEEKTALLQEVHHRVKNNLQIVSSLLSLQRRRLRSQVAKETLRATQDRIRSMALLHETLYREGNMSRVNCSVYLRHLCAHLSRSFAEVGDRVHLEPCIDPVQLDLDLAIPCGLIVNELVTNAFKHAFPDRRTGKIEVRLSAEEGNRVVLSVADDGVGIPDTTPKQNLLWAPASEAPVDSSDTLGSQLITGLARQMSATVEVKTNPGTAVRIVFTTMETERPA